MLVKTEAIVLKSMKYRDTSKIVTFFSKEYGKIRGIAKGARTAKNKFGSALEPLSHSMLVFYKKEHQDLHLISQCDSYRVFKNLTSDLDRMAVALSILELTDQLTHHEERSPVLYPLIFETLKTLDASVKNYSSYLLAFEIRLAGLFGYAMNFETCGNCGKPLVVEQEGKNIVFQIVHGSFLCRKCSQATHSASTDLLDERTIWVSAPEVQILRRLLNAKFPSLSSLEYDVSTGNKIGELLRLYLKYHFDGLKPLKSTIYLQK